ncbi:MAG: hypothetical protein D6701_11875, partial [Gemmatimonadetes bacterium]
MRVYAPGRTDPQTTATPTGARPDPLPSVAPRASDMVAAPLPPTPRAPGRAPRTGLRPDPLAGPAGPTLGRTRRPVHGRAAAVFNGTLRARCPTSPETPPPLPHQSRPTRMFDRHTRIALSLAAAAWVPTGGSAQARPDSIPADSLRAYVLEGIPVSVPRSTTSAGGVAAVRVRFDSMNVVPAPTLEEVLRALPLVQIRENSRGEAQPALRGAEDRQIAILVDGVPLTLGWDHRTDLSVVPMTAARGLDLHRGLASLLYGPNVLGGVVEIDVARGRGRMAAPPPLTASASLDQEGATNLAASVGRLVEVGAGEW